MVQLALCNFLRFRIYSFIELFYTENVNSCAYIHIVITAFEHRKQLASPEKCLCVCVCIVPLEKSKLPFTCWTIDIKLFWKPISNAHNSILMCLSPNAPNAQKALRMGKLYLCFQFGRQVKWASKNFSLPTRKRLSAFNCLNERSLTALLYVCLYALFAVTPLPLLYAILPDSN